MALSAFAKTPITSNHRWFLMAIPALLRKAQQWFFKTPERALDQAYEAAKMIEALGVKPTRPSVAVALGDDYLLRMDMSRAAAFWSIENPIGRRDRKGGATKRKQHEIEAKL